MNNLIPKIASVMHLIKLNSAYKIYANGTIVLNSYTKPFPKLDTTLNPFSNMYVHCCNGNEEIVFISDNDNLDESNKLLQNDSVKQQCIFDSSIDDISRYEMKMYLFVNNDLKMGKGKIGGQVGHAVGRIVGKCIRDNNEEFIHWENSFEKKVVCKATYEELQKLKLMDKSVTILDMGKTQIAPNSLTVVGFYPMYNKDIPTEFSSYKLL